MSNKQSVVVLVDDGYQELEFWYPVLRLREEGIAVEVIGLDGDRTYVSHLGYPVIPDRALADVAAGGVAGVIVPGGRAGATLAAAPAIVGFVREAAQAGAIVGAVSQGTAVLAAAGLALDTCPTAADADGLAAFFPRFSAALGAARR